MPQKPEVWIVDRDSESWDSIVNLLGSIGITANTYASAEEFLQSGNDTEAGCVLTELLLPGMSGLELLERLALNPLGPVSIIVTSHATIATTIRSLQLGSLTLLERPCNDLALLDAIRDALKIDTLTRQASIKRARTIGAIKSLSSGERRVLDMVMTGLGNKLIAKRLDVSVRTVESRRQRIFQKLGVTSMPELVTKVVQAEFDSPVHTIRRPHFLAKARIESEDRR